MRFIVVASRVLTYLKEMDLQSNSGYQIQQSDEQQADCPMNVGRNVLEELKAERNALDPSFLHCVRLLDKGVIITIVKLLNQSFRNIFVFILEIQALSSSSDSNQKQTEKIYVPLAEQRKYNLVGRLLGPKGLTLKRIQAETQTKMSILGRSSMKDKQKEEELRNSDDPTHQHLKDDLHILIEANPPSSSQKLAAGVAEVRKMLIPPVSIEMISLYKELHCFHRFLSNQDNQTLLLNMISREDNSSHHHQTQCEDTHR